MQVQFYLNRILFLIILAGLIGLGVWQLQRRDWKQGVLAQAEQALANPPVMLQKNMGLMPFQRVRVRGDVLPPVLRLMPQNHMIAAVQLPDGMKVLVEREKDFSGTIDVVGYVWPPGQKNAFTPDTRGFEFYWRDLMHMAQITRSAPLLIVEGDPDLSHIPNNHLHYAITWFGLAVAWMGVMFFKWRQNQA